MVVLSPDYFQKRVVKDNQQSVYQYIIHNGRLISAHEPKLLMQAWK